MNYRWDLLHNRGRLHCATDRAAGGKNTRKVLRNCQVTTPRPSAQNRYRVVTECPYERPAKTTGRPLARTLVLFCNPNLFRAEVVSRPQIQKSLSVMTILQHYCFWRLFQLLDSLQERTYRKNFYVRIGDVTNSKTNGQLMGKSSVFLKVDI